MPFTTIDDPSAYFHTQLFSGTGSSQSVTNDANAGDFKPDWVWIKKRAGGSVRNHILTDSTRGVTKCLSTSLNDGEFTNTNGLTAFGTDGFTVGSYDSVNESSGTYVAWQWKANGGTTSSNSDGSITSTVQANTTAGFSIVQWDGNTTSGATVGHGLGVAPHYVQVKRKDRDGDAWRSFHQPLGAEKYMEIFNTDAVQDSADGAWNDTAPTSSVFSLGSGASTNGGTLIAYCFAPIQGYSKFGSYTGNGSADGPFVYTGFKPAWVMTKNTNNSFGSNNMWLICDNKRVGINPVRHGLFADANDAESADDFVNIDFLSNGFKLRANEYANNYSGDTFIYFAFAESPFVSSKGVPATAR